MFEKPEELLWAQSELQEEPSRIWPRMKAVVGLTSTLAILSVSVVLVGVHPANTRTAEFVLEVSRWIESVSSSSLCPCLYVILNILILILGVKSTSKTAAADSSSSSSASTIPSYYYPCQCSHLHHKAEAVSDTTTSPSSENLLCGENMILKAEWKAEESSLVTVSGEAILESLPKHQTGDIKAAETEKTPALVLSRSCSLRELHCKKVNKLSNLSRETNKCSDVAPVEVIFEICSGEEGGEWHGDKEKEGNLTCEELNAKAESFIMNFYRELKMQREDSWKRLCAIYRKSS